jgi:UPF0755 protein
MKKGFCAKLQLFLAKAISIIVKKLLIFAFRIREMGRKSRKWSAGIFVLLFLLAAYVFVQYYGKIYSSAARVDAEDPYLYIKTGWSRADLLKHLNETGVIKDTASFNWVADQKSFMTPKAGKYRLRDGMSNNSLINLLRSGQQVPVQLTFNSIRTLEDLAGRVASQIEADSLDLLNTFRSSQIQAKYGFDSRTFLGMFIPNTYELYWNTSAEGFVARMAKEFKRFWTEERMTKARKLGLSQSEVAILASIVQAEQMSRPDERAKVAGLYINRLRKGMRLQSDPTLIFALGDFSIKRVLNKHKELNSPYNTYLKAGLPPGPINLPEIASLEAVLNYESHSYLYMCAKADFSGYHHFSRNLSQHNVYAREYQRELNRRRIMR